MEAYLFRSALGDMLRPQRLLVWALVSVVIFGIAMGFQRLTPDATPMEAYTLMSSVLVYRLLALTSAIFATAVVAQEVEQKTIVYVLTRPIPRWKILLFRLLAAVVSVFIVCAMAATLLTLAVNKGFPPVYFRDLTALAVGALAYTSLFTLVSLLVNRAMIYCLVFAFGWETAVANMPGGMYWMSLYNYLTSIAAHPQPKEGDKGFLDALAGTIGSTSIPAQTAWIAMPAFAVACATLAAWWFSQFEYTPREDAE